MELEKAAKALAHENRLRILNLLRKQSLCVCELRNIMGINQSNASRHLKKLKNAGLIDYDKKAQWVYYKLNEEQIERYNFLKVLIEEDFDREEMLKDDLDNLKLYQNSEVECDGLDEAELF
ncbi:ArsR/SmtB family transcription factor [Halarsenatibacter silvermanii]|uniref:Transcriptional regulator, ArsR family n=1 Tax=Halarsenatibacter silvermanii TaxID=321763 RepID=A0A1G9TWJ8_9FIRM|nr:metalloregulator ArsR/SmtB family transcription factor [Halarsenatibacter silvermanii]SDM51774.1 transcriptional regulator, ArsR family [Halarsenatibacter silvermanii]